MTIVVPSFQQGRYLATCLRSLAGQIPGRLETLVYDNVSMDETQDILAKWRDPATRITVERDRGQADALNRGFREARGDVVGWLNADDMLMPGALEQAVRILDETDTDIVYGQCAHLDERGCFTEYFPLTRSFDAHELRNYSDFIPQPATFFRRSKLEQVGLLDATLHYAMDWDLWCRFARVGARFRFVPEVWAGARIHPEAKTSRGGLEPLLEVWRVNARHRTLPLPMLPILFAAYCANRYFAFRLTRVPLLQDKWRQLTGGRRSVTIDGVAQGGLIVKDSARIRYPTYEPLARVSLDLSDAEHPPASVSVNGRAIMRGRGVYEADFPGDEVKEMIDIQITNIDRGLPAPFRVSHFAPMHPHDGAEKLAGSSARR